MKVQIRKLQSSHNNLAKEVYTGITEDLPTVGQIFEMDNEFLYTTTVLAVRKINDFEYSFGTKNSLYFLTVLEYESSLYP